MTEPILYSFRRCPYAIRARMALLVAGFDGELRELTLQDKPADMLAYSPKGTVPVLVTAAGEVIDESIDVMLWALDQHDPDHWLNNKQQSLALITQFDDQFKPLLDRYKYAIGYPELTEVEHRDATLEHLIQLEQLLQQQKFLCDNHIRLADVALFPFIRQYAFVDKTWFDQLSIKHVQAWLEFFLNHDLFKMVMQKYPLYNDGFCHRFPTNHTPNEPT